MTAHWTIGDGNLPSPAKRPDLVTEWPQWSEQAKRISSIHVHISAGLYGYICSILCGNSLRKKQQNMHCSGNLKIFQKYPKGNCETLRTWRPTSGARAKEDSYLPGLCISSHRLENHLIKWFSNLLFDKIIIMTIKRENNNCLYNTQIHTHIHIMPTCAPLCILLILNNNNFRQ